MILRLTLALLLIAQGLFAQVEELGTVEQANRIILDGNANRCPFPIELKHKINGAITNSDAAILNLPLPIEFKRKLAGSFPVSNAFAPSDLSGLVGWYKSGVGITLNGSTVSQWDDSSGTGNHASHGTATAQPTYNSSDANFNGYASLTFDGTTDLLFANGLLSSIINGTDVPFTIVMAVKPVLTAANPTAIGTNEITVGNTQFRLRFRAAGVSTFFLGLRDGAGTDVTFSGGTSTATAQIVRAQSSGTAGEIFSNNVSVASGAFNVDACTATWFAFGATPTSATAGANFFGGEIAEVAIYSRLLTAGEQAQVETYFKNKFAAY
jgi:hypothetical protein